MGHYRSRNSTPQTLHGTGIYAYIDRPGTTPGLIGIYYGSFMGRGGKHTMAYPSPMSTHHGTPKYDETALKTCGIYVVRILLHLMA